MLLSLALAATLSADPAPKPFELKDGDRIVWLGSTLVEREQKYGYWETALLATNPDKNITLRNLGWSGDTVHGEARGRFDYANAEKCFRQIVDQTLELKPTAIFVSYGTNESFEGKEGLPKFEKGLEKLLDALKPANARVVLFTPVPVEKSPGLPDPKPRNEALALYGEAIKAVAGKRGLPVADLFADFQKHDVNGRLTENGLHYTETGYRALAKRFVAQVTPGASFSAAGDSDALRQAIVAKNELFFHRWRPQNETYLFGFRKHEQGRNAKEVAEFDPLVAKAEADIAKLLKGQK